MSNQLASVVFSTKDYWTTVATIFNLFSDSDCLETDYIRIFRYKNDDLIFTKKNYNQIENAVATTKERMDLIADYIKNKVKNPLQGMLFE